MNVLIISIDRGLLGKNSLGDVIERHREYGKFVESIDIIVFAKRGFGEFSLSYNVKSHPTNSFSRFFYPRDARKLGKKLFSQKKYDLIVAQDPFFTGWVGLQLKKIYHSKLLIHLHGDFFENPKWLQENWKNKILLPLAKYCVKQADAIRVMSHGQKEKLVNMGIADPKIRVISTPVDIQKFRNYSNSAAVKNLKERLEAQGIKKIILMVGRKDKVKDFVTLFRAVRRVFEKIPDVGLWLVGNYSEEERDAIPVPDAKRRVFISERVDSVNLPSYYKLCYVVVLSSTSESFGKVLVEGNACGKPVVSTATTGAKEIIVDGYNGFLVPVGDSEKLAEKILALLQNPSLAQTMGENGKKLVFEKFDGRKNTEKIINYWRDIVSK